MFRRSEVADDVFDQIVEEIDGDVVDVVSEGAAGKSDTESSTPDETPDGREDAGEVSAEPRRRRKVIRWGVRIIAGIVVVAVLSTAAVLGWQLKQRADTAAAGRAALEAAKTYAVTLSSMDSADIDKNIGQVLDGATGEFKSMYGQASTQLRQLLVDNKAASRGVVIDSAVKSAAVNEVEVMLFLDQSVTNAVNPQPRIDRLRVVMTMERVDNRWLASKFDIE